MAQANIIASATILMETNLKSTTGDYVLDFEARFEHLFKSHFKSLHGFASNILQDDIVAEEMVQNVFFKLWERRHENHILQSEKAYLYRAVHNESINYLKHQKVKDRHQKFASYNTQETLNSDANMAQKELQFHIQNAISNLPPKCRTVFELSRYQDLKYREIANTLGLSVKTVEHQMGKALRILRAQLIDFLPILCTFFINF